MGLQAVLPKPKPLLSSQDMKWHTQIFQRCCSKQHACTGMMLSGNKETLSSASRKPFLLGNFQAADPGSQRLIWIFRGSANGMQAEQAAGTMFRHQTGLLTLRLTKTWQPRCFCWQREAWRRHSSCPLPPCPPWEPMAGCCLQLVCS